MSAKAVLERAVAALNSNDEAAFLALISPDAKLTAPGGLNYSGREAGRQWYRLWVEACPDKKVHYSNIIDQGDRLVGEGVFNGTQTGVLHLPTGDVPPTGRHVTATFAVGLETSGDQITNMRHYFDVMDMMAQLGLIGAEAPATA
jgi:predicted ester cyclase